MSIRTKTLLIVGLTLLSLIAILYAFSQVILLQSYVDLEEEIVARNVQRAINATQEEIAFLSSTSLDYAHWDDTYEYIQGLNETYIEENIFESVLDNFGVNFLLLMNEAGEVIHSQAYDTDTQETMPIPESLMAFVAHNEALIHPRDANGDFKKNGIAGFVMLPEGGTMLSAVPILPSTGQGEWRGAFVWGRYIDELLVNRLAERTQLTLAFHPVMLDADHPELADILPVLLNQPQLVEPLSGEMIAGYALLRDINQQPGLILMTEMPRSVYQQGQNGISYFLASMVLLGVMSAAAIGLMMERGVLSRLAYLNRHVSDIQTSGDMSSRVSMGGDDELTSLASNVNAMLDSLQAQEKIKLARDNALEASRIKAEILANVSHDARTPLTVIQLRTDMMMNGIYGAVNPKQHEILRTIMISAQQLLSFANNLLEGAQLETGRLELKISPLEPAKLLETIRTTLSPLAGKKDLQLGTELDDDVPLVVQGDEKRLEQIVTNLISNAIKFTSSGSVSARIYRVDNDHWGIDVKDTGPGISVENQKQIFTPFWQVDSSTTRSANSGVGLGLTIVQQLTVLMGGTVSVNSTAGSGSTFTIVLPLEVPVRGLEYEGTALRLRD